MGYLWLGIIIAALSSLSLITSFYEEVEHPRSFAQSAAASNDLKTILSDVTTATAYKYAVMDNTLTPMDTLKIIQNPQGGYIAVYHASKGGKFYVRVATSTNLLNWTYRADIDSSASQPYITALSDGGYLVAYEKDSSGATKCSGGGRADGNCLAFRYYANINALLTGKQNRLLYVPRTLSGCNEGTPNIYSVKLNPDINNSIIDVGYHYHRNCDVDRQARGRLTNWQWQGQAESSINSMFESLRNPSIGGNAGDRDSFVYQGQSFTLYEAQATKNNFGTWQLYLYDVKQPSLSKLSIKSHKGSKSFANGTVAQVTSPAGKPALVMAYYVFSEGAALGEGGPLIFYKELSTPVSPKPSNPPSGSSTNITFIMYLHGIGNGGDGVNKNASGNFNPHRPQRVVTVEIFNTQNQLVMSKQILVAFNKTKGYMIGSLGLGNTFPTGAYTIKVKTDSYLKTLIPGIQTITNGKTITLPEVTLTAGDINNDNRINVIDFNLFSDCYSDLLPATSCSIEHESLADLNDDGEVNQYDYNFFVRELTSIGGN